MDATRFSTTRPTRPFLKGPEQRPAAKDEIVHYVGEAVEWRLRFVEAWDRRRELRDARRFEAQIALLFDVTGEV